MTFKKVSIVSMFNRCTCTVSDVRRRQKTRMRIEPIVLERAPAYKPEKLN